MAKVKIVGEDKVLSENSKNRILKHTEILECACPQHLLKVLDEINNFQEYETGCIIKYPKDKDIHSWLLEESKKLEQLATGIIVELMRKEGIVDQDNYFCTPPVAIPT